MASSRLVISSMSVSSIEPLHYLRLKRHNCSFNSSISLFIVITTSMSSSSVETNSISSESIFESPQPRKQNHDLTVSSARYSFSLLSSWVPGRMSPPDQRRRLETPGTPGAPSTLPPPGTDLSFCRSVHCLYECYDGSRGGAPLLSYILQYKGVAG
jgi:hypothetical protein